MSDKDNKDNAGVLDRLLEKAVSRKLVVWLMSSGFLYLGNIDGDQWVAVSLAYVGIQGVADIATAWKSGTILSKE
jgi:hypothetical protein